MEWVEIKGRKGSLEMEGGGFGRAGLLEGAELLIERTVHGAGEPLPSDGQCLCESPSKQRRFHTTQISESKREGRWVEKRERMRGREKMQAGRAPAPLANATGTVASFPGVPSGPRAPSSLSLRLHLLEAARSV